MNNKERMIDALSALLEDGETLLYPIYGILSQGNHQYYGYFGFAGNDLLIALISGKYISDTIRIPLDVKTVKVKQTLFFKQYIIDIAFLEEAPCRITASPRVLMIDSQKENLPHFLEYLTSKVQGLQTEKLKDIEGEKIRWQYFNTFIYLLLPFVPMLVFMLVFSEFEKGNVELTKVIEIILTVGTMWFVILLPFIVLSLLNRYFFGKIVCVFKEEGIALENHFVPWNDICEIVYCPRMSTRTSLNYTYATVCVNPANKTAYTFDVLHFPLYGLRKIRKYNARVKIRVDKQGIASILFMALLPTLVAFLIYLIL